MENIKDDEMVCPSCGANLLKQKSFNPNKGFFVCEKCGQLSIKPAKLQEYKKFKGAAWFCKNCGENLNTQENFNIKVKNWKCTNCGCDNEILVSDPFSNLM